MRVLFLACRQFTFFLCPRLEGRWGEISLSLLTRIQILEDQGSTLMTSFKFNYFLIPNIVTLGVKALNRNWGGQGVTIQSITLGL